MVYLKYHNEILKYLTHRGEQMKKIVIFGTGNAGRAIYKAFNSNTEYKIVAFIDNNKDMVGKDYKGIPIFAPADYDKLDFDYIAYSGVWHNEMRTQLEELGLDKNKIKHICEGDLIYTSKDREKAVDEIVKRLDEYFINKKIDYFIIGSSGVSLLREKSLSCSSDVDFYLTNYSDLLTLESDLSVFFSDLNIEITRFDKNDITYRKNNIDHIIITNNEEDKAIIDVSIYYSYGDYDIINFKNSKCIYLPKHIFAAGTMRKKYKDFYINMLVKYDEYYTLTYGKNYLEIPKSWSESDYGNLVTIEKLKQICSKDNTQL